MRANVPARDLPSRSPRPATIAGFALCAALAYAAAARAQVVGCGTVVGPNAAVVLDADLDCSRATGGITVIGPATLDLGGNVISCAAETDRAIGITLVGRRAQLRNGSVVGCQAGVEVAGDGRHRIEQVVATANVESAFRLDSGANTLRGNTGAGTTNGIDFLVRGDGNRLAGNTTSVAGLQPAPIGFRVLGNGNRLRGNASADHRQQGFLVDFPFARNVLLGNSSTGNGTAGIQVDGPRTTLTGNSVVANNREGILVTAPAARVTRNDVRDNGTSGIRLAPEIRDGVIARNTSLGNDRRSVGAFDLEDGTPGCTTNRWRANVFVTANDGCIE